MRLCVWSNEIPLIHVKLLGAWRYSIGLKMKMIPTNGHDSNDPMVFCNVRAANKNNWHMFDDRERRAKQNRAPIFGFASYWQYILFCIW